MANTSFKTFSNQELEQVLHAILGRQPEPRPERENTALVIIDMQYVDAHPDYGLGARRRSWGWRAPWTTTGAGWGSRWSPTSSACWRRPVGPESRWSM